MQVVRSGLPTGLPELAKVQGPCRSLQAPWPKVRGTGRDCFMPDAKIQGPWTMDRGPRSWRRRRHGRTHGLLKPFAHEPRTYGRPPSPPKSAPLRPEKAPWLLEWRFLSLVISFGGRVATDQGRRSDVFEARCGELGSGIWVGARGDVKTECYSST